MKGHGLARDGRILFVTLSNIGDLVMTTPLLTTLHNLYPNHLVDIVADRRSGELLRACPYVGDILWKDKRSSWVQSWRFLKKIRRQYYDLVIDLRGPTIAFLSRAKRKGLKKKRTQNMHAVEHHFTALSGLVSSSNIPPTKLWLPIEEQPHLDSVYFDLVKGKRMLALAPGANWPGKIWHLSAYTKLINLLTEEFDGACLLGGPNDVQRSEEILQGANLPTYNLCGTTSLLETARCLAGAKAFVGNDSGVGHMAAALSIPTLTVFGEGEPNRYRPWGDRAKIILSPEKDLVKLPAESVAQALREHLEALKLT